MGNRQRHRDAVRRILSLPGSSISERIPPNRALSGFSGLTPGPRRFRPLLLSTLSAISLESEDVSETAQSRMVRRFGEVQSKTSRANAANRISVRPRGCLFHLRRYAGTRLYAGGGTSRFQRRLDVAALPRLPRHSPRGIPGELRLAAGRARLDVDGVSGLGAPVCRGGGLVILSMQTPTAPFAWVDQRRRPIWPW